MCAPGESVCVRRPTSADLAHKVTERPCNFISRAPVLVCPSRSAPALAPASVLAAIAVAVGLRSSAMHSVVMYFAARALAIRHFPLVRLSPRRDTHLRRTSKDVIHTCNRAGLRPNGDARRSQSTHLPNNSNPTLPEALIGSYC